MRLLTAGLLCWCATAATAYAADGENAPKNAPNKPDSLSGYDSARRHGGPDSTHGALQRHDVAKESFFREHVLKDALKPYYRFKKCLQAQHGLAFGLDYNFLHEAATESLGDDQATGGVFRLYGHWTLVGRGTPNTGEFVFRVENRHAIGGGVAPEDFFKEIGSLLKTANSFADFGWGITNLQWQHWFANGRYGVAIGEVDLRDWVDGFDLGNWRTALLSAAVTYPTNPLPSAGLGAAVFAYFRECNTPYMVAGFADANGRNDDLGFDTFFDQAEFYSFVELGWTPSFDEKDDKNLRLTYWHQDAATVKGSPEGWGLSFSAAWKFEDKWAPFLRGGWAEGGTIATRAALVGGLGVHFRSHDLLGFALGWAQPHDRALRDQITGEAFYRVQISQNLGITPGVELLFDPSNNPAESFIAVFNLRLQLAF